MDPTTVLDVIRYHAEKTPNATAIVSVREAVTYDRLHRKITQFDARLRRAHLRRDSRVAIFAPADLDGLLVSIAAPCACVAVYMNPQLTYDEVINLLGPLRIDAVIAPAVHRTARLLAENREIPFLPLGTSKNFECGERPILDDRSPPEGRHQDDRQEADELSDIAVILFTSGTSGDSKRVPMTHASMLAAGKRVQEWFGLSNADRCLHVSPAWYSHGLTLTVWTPLITGGSIAIPSSRASVNLEEWFLVLRPTWYSAGPALHRAIAQAHVRFNGKLAHNLRFIVSGGAPLAPEIFNELGSEFGVPVLEHFGMTEAAQMAANLPLAGKQKPGTCGITVPGTVMVRTFDGRTAAPGEGGEILLRGPTIMPGYLDDPEACASAFADGWLRTGDLGSLDEDGFLTIHGRIKEIINKGGEKIAPAEIERALLRHPDVVEAAAYAIPHKSLGEDIAAAVVLRDGAVEGPADLRRFLIAYLSPARIPREIIVQSDLPRGHAGKVSRRRLARSHRDVILESQDVATPVEQAIIDIWRSLLKCECVNLDDDFFILGGDSILAVQMVLEVERVLQMRVPDAALFDLTSVRALMKELEDPEVAPSTGVLKAARSSDRPPFFFLHGDLEGGGLYARPLLDHLLEDQPVFLVPPHKIDGGEAPDTIQKMALDRLALIEQAAPSGPLRVGGYCNGALTAYELAQLLMQRGRSVELVVMIDPPAFNLFASARALHAVLRAFYECINPYDPASARKLTAAWTLVGSVFERIERNSRRSLVAVIKVAGLRTLSLCRIGGRKQLPTHPTTSEKTEWYRRAVRNYFPEKTLAPLLIISAGFRSHLWARYGNRVRVVDLPFDHRDCIGSGIDALGKVIRPYLQSGKP